MALLPSANSAQIGSLLQDVNEVAELSATQITDGQSLFSTPHVRYPADLGTPPHEKWILFEVKSGRHVLDNYIIPEDGSKDESTLASVALYLPEGALNSKVDVTYEAEDIGPVLAEFLGWAIQKRDEYRRQGDPVSAKGILNRLESYGQSVMAGTAGNVKQALKDMLSGNFSAAVGDLSSAAANVTSAISGTAGGAKELTSGIMKAVVPAAEARLLMSGASIVDRFFGGDKGGGEAGISNFIGERINPRLEYIFQKVQFRQHSLTFSLVPRSKAEADAIDQIITIFQYYMLPSYGNREELKLASFMIGYPYEFAISMFSQYKPLGNHHFNIIGRSVLTSCAINNAPNNEVAMIFDPQGGYYPVAVTMTLNFTELVQLGRDSTEIVRGQKMQLIDPRFDTSLF